MLHFDLSSPHIIRPSSDYFDFDFYFDKLKLANFGMQQKTHTAYALFILLLMLATWLVVMNPEPRSLLYQNHERVMSTIRGLHLWDPHWTTGRRKEITVPKNIKTTAETSIIAINCHVHSASLTLSVGGRVDVVIGLERIFEIPNYGSSYEMSQFRVNSSSRTKAMRCPTRYVSFSAIILPPSSALPKLWITSQWMMDGISD